MSVTNGVKVPTSYKNLNEPKIHGITWYVVAAWGLFFIFASITGAVLVYAGLPRIPAVLVPLTLFGTVAFVTVRDKQQCRRTWKHIVLIVRTFRNNSEFKKYRAEIDDIKKLVPVEAVEDTGLIKYTNGTTARIVSLQAPRVSDDEIDQHNRRIMSVINSLYGSFSFHYVVLSSAEKVNHLARSTADQLNRSGQTQPLNEHLYSIYEHAVSRQVKDVDREEFLFVFFPVTEKNSEAFMSGVLKELVRAHIIPVTVNDRNQVISILRRLLTCNS
jgi:hypothetical protein